MRPPSGSLPCRHAWKSAGISFRHVRSPVPPKRTRSNDMRKGYDRSVHRMSMARFAIAAALVLTPAAFAQVAVSAAADQEKLLASADPKLAANKRLVYDFWREVFEAGHMELAEKYMAESYIQHNPNVPTGRAAFVEFFARFKKPKA